MKKQWLTFLILIASVCGGPLQASEQEAGFYLSEKAEADKVIRICGYGEKERYNLYVAKLDSSRLVHGNERTAMETNIDSLFKEISTDICQKISESAKHIVRHYMLLLNGQ